MKRTSDFESKVARFISSYGLLGGDAPIIVALSGGADSVALLAVLTSLGYRCIAAHCNFHLRGDESNRDQHHAESVCESLGTMIEIIHFDVPQRMEETGESMEMACRSLRYEWFEQLKRKHAAQAVATGHHRDDNVETMLLNLLRGTGISGAAGMASKTDRRVSPLLCCSKSEILRYLDYRGLSFVTDSSNIKTDVKRNKIRNVIMPVVRKQFPCADTTLAHSANCLSEDHNLFTEMAEKLGKRLFKNNRIHIGSLHNATTYPNALLYHMLAPMGFNRTQTDDLLAAAGSSGKKVSSGDMIALVNRGYIEVHSIEDINEECAEITIAPGTTAGGLISVDEVTQIVAERNPDIIYLDAAALDGNPRWELRGWRDGDRMKPFGMNGRSRLLSDIFSDAKLSIIEKDRIRLLTRNGIIIWAIGLRASEHFRISDRTTRIIRLKKIV